MEVQWVRVYEFRLGSAVKNVVDAVWPVGYKATMADVLQMVQLAAVCYE